MFEKEDKLQEQLEDVLDELKGNADDFMFRRISHKNFAKVVFWICVRGRNEEFVLSGDLAEFLKVTGQRAYYIMQDLCKCGLLRKDYKSSAVAWYWLTRDEFGNYKMNKYFNMACKTLGIKNKIVLLLLIL